MKKNLIIAAGLLISSFNFLIAEALCVAVPKKYLVEEASLVVYMLDALGNQCVGTCRLHESFEQRNIVQKDLCIQRPDSLVQLSDSIEITSWSQPRDNEVLLHIEFDENVQVVRVLIVKDNLLEEDSFDIVSIPVNSSMVVDDVDEFSNLIDGIDSATVSSSKQDVKSSVFNQYALYAKIYCMMQYKHARRKVRDLTVWLCKKR